MNLENFKKDWLGTNNEQDNTSIDLTKKLEVISNKTNYIKYCGNLILFGAMRVTTVDKDKMQIRLADIMNKITIWSLDELPLEFLNKLTEVSGYSILSVLDKGTIVFKGNLVLQVGFNTYSARVESISITNTGKPMFRGRTSIFEDNDVTPTKQGKCDIKFRQIIENKLKQKQQEENKTEEIIEQVEVKTEEKIEAEDKDSNLDDFEDFDVVTVPEQDIEQENISEETISDESLRRARMKAGKIENFSISTEYSRTNNKYRTEEELKCSQKISDMIVKYLNKNNLLPSDLDYNLKFSDKNRAGGKRTNHTYSVIKGGSQSVDIVLVNWLIEQMKDEILENINNL